MVKISDVARHADVSPSTVSYVLSGKRSISEQTRRRVLSSIATLGYRPHAGARALAADPRQDPLAFTVTRTGPVIRVAAAGRRAPRRWQVLLAGLHAVGPVAGGTAVTHPHGTLVTAGQAELDITLG